MNNKKIIFTFFVTVIIVVIGFFLIMYTYDPLQLFHKHLSNENRLVKNMRQQAAGIINQYKFDSIIIGTSMLENTSSKEASEELGGKFVNISIDGSDFYERSVILHYVLKQKNTKKILYSLDNDGLIGRTKKRIDNFDYLYDNDKLNDFRAYTNVKYLRCLLYSNKCFHDKLDFDRPNAWYKDIRYSSGFGGLSNWFKAKNNGQIKDALKGILGTIKNIQNNNIINTKEIDTRVYMSKQYIDDYILSFVKKYPDTEFILVLPPYSRLKYAMLAQYDKDKFGIYQSIVKYLVSKSDTYTNIKIFGWGNHSFVDDISNYKDPSHYEYTINSWMLKAIKDNEGLLSSSNINSYLDEFKNKALNFDLNEVANKIEKYLNATKK